MYPAKILNLSISKWRCFLYNIDSNAKFACFLAFIQLILIQASISVVPILRCSIFVKKSVPSIAALIGRLYLFLTYGFEWFPTISRWHHFHYHVHRHCPPHLNLLV